MQPLNLEEARIVFKIIAEIIKEERKKQGKSQRLFADEYAIQRSLLNRLEKGESEPRLVSIMTVCEALGIKPSELFRRIEAKLPKGFSLVGD